MNKYEAAIDSVLTFIASSRGTYITLSLQKLTSLITRNTVLTREQVLPLARDVLFFLQKINLVRKIRTGNKNYYIINQDSDLYKMLRGSCTSSRHCIRTALARALLDHVQDEQIVCTLVKACIVEHCLDEK